MIVGLPALGIVVQGFRIQDFEVSGGGVLGATSLLSFWVKMWSFAKFIVPWLCASDVFNVSSVAI